MDDPTPIADEDQAASGNALFLDRLRQQQEASGQNRMARLQREEAPPLATSARFEDLPEYRKLMAHKSMSTLTGVANPFYRPHEVAAGATTVIGGREMMNFASYDYLATNTHPHVAARAAEAIGRYGISASASRLVAGERPLHAELEDRLANIYGTPAAVCFVSGYLTNLASISCLMDQRDLVIHDELIHNSVLAGIKLSGATRRFFKHNDAADLEEVLRSVTGKFRRVLVVVEGVYSMDGDIADLPAFVSLRSRYGFWLMVDEAHALGVLGETGRGTFQHFGIDSAQVDLWMGTLSKTSSSCGGYIAGSAALVEILKAEAGGFIYSVGLAPVLAAAAIASLDILEREPERVAALRRNGHIFLEEARKAGLDTGTSAGFSVVPVLVGDSLRAVQLSNTLFEAGVNALPIIYPAVQEGMARLRFFLTSAHTPEQIREVVALTAASLQDLAERKVGIDIQQAMKMLS